MTEHQELKDFYPPPSYDTCKFQVPTSEDLSFHSLPSVEVSVHRYLDPWSLSHLLNVLTWEQVIDMDTVVLGSEVGPV